MIKLALALGHPVRSRTNGRYVDRLRPLSRDKAPKNSMSAIYGTAAFPFHTDCANRRTPPHYIVLSLAPGSSSDRATLLKDSREISPQEAVALSRAVYLVTSTRQPFYANVLVPAFIRYDPCCMRPASASFAAAERIFSSFLQRSKTTVIEWESRRMLVIDNHRLLHARAEGPAETDRVLFRVLIGES
jgi:L-asparagine oxygenase